MNPACDNFTTSAIPPTSVTIAGSPSEKACNSETGSQQYGDRLNRAYVLLIHALLRHRLHSQASRLETRGLRGIEMSG